jgi:hypothetical protein
MQAEAGQPLEEIIARKDLERRASDGLFFWGVGNAPALMSRGLARTGAKVPVLFSIMKSKPKAVDAAPTRVWLWRRYFDCHGRERPVPPAVVVTSRGTPLGGPKRHHAALICRSDGPLRLAVDGRCFDPGAYRNAGPGGAPVGASQVTSLLRAIGPERDHSAYRVNLSAWLADSYWVRLTDPVELTPEQRQVLAGTPDLSEDDWRNFARDCKSAREPERMRQRDLLF